MSLTVEVISGLMSKTPKGVTYSFVFDECHRLASRNIRIHVIRPVFESASFSYGLTFHGLEKPIDVRALIYSIKNLNCYHPLSLLRNPIKIYWENLYAINALEIARKNEIDLIHAHFAYPQGLVGMLIKRKLRRPLIVTLHGYDILVEHSVKYGIRLDKRYDLIIQEVLNDADAIIVASKAIYNEASKLCEKRDKIQLIPNGVDIKRFNPQLDSSVLREKWNIKDQFVVFTVRHHRPQYGIEYLIKAAALLLKWKKNVIFIIGGDGPMRQYYEKMALKLGLRDRMIFIGEIPRLEVPYYYAMSDIVVVPSLQEGWGLVVTEAMATGKPVIGTRVGGIVDQIVDGYNGFLVPPRDPKAIAKRILYLIDNPSEAKKMGMNGRKLAEEKFNIEKRIDKIIELYRKLLG